MWSVTELLAVLLVLSGTASSQSKVRKRTLTLYCSPAPCFMSHLAPETLMCAPEPQMVPVLCHLPELVNPVSAGFGR